MALANQLLVLWLVCSLGTDCLSVQRIAVDWISASHLLFVMVLHLGV